VEASAPELCYRVPATERGRVVPQSLQVARTMDQPKHKDVIVADLIDQPVATDDQLSHRRLIELENDPTALGHLLKRSSVVAGTPHCLRVRPRLLLSRESGSQDQGRAPRVGVARASQRNPIGGGIRTRDLRVM
jgi:hypothetical protein